MHIVDEPIETVHLYVVREEPKQPYTVLPLVAACLCLLAITGLAVYSGEHPAYEHQTLTIPARFLPPQTFTAAQPIIPTGIKTYPATTAHGTLTITNGSVIAQTLPAGLIFLSKSGVSVITDQAVYVPAGSADGFGIATVQAHTLVAGNRGNILIYDVDNVIGVNIYVRNLSTFTGGKDAYSVKFVTARDQQAALLQARGILLRKSSGLHEPCRENVSGSSTLHVVWVCRYVTYKIPAFMLVTAIRLNGKNLIIDVLFIVQPKRYWAK